MKRNILLLVFCASAISINAQDDPTKLINIKGDTVSETDYEYPPVDGIILFRKNDKCGFRNPEMNVEVYDEKYTDVMYLNKGVVMFFEKWGDQHFYDVSGKKILEDIKRITKPEIEMDIDLRNDSIVRAITVDKVGILNFFEGWVIKPTYSDIKDLGDPFYYIEKDGKCGLLDKATGKEILTKFDAMMPFSGGLAAVRKKDKWGFINVKGEVVIKPAFYSSGYFIEGQAYVRLAEKGDLYGYIDMNGKIIENPNPDALFTFTTKVKRDIIINPGYLASRLTGKIFEKDYKGFYFNFCDYSIVERKSDHKQFIYHISGRKTELNESFNCSSNFYNNYAVVYIIEDSIKKYGYIDTSGYIILPFKYLEAYSFNSIGLAKVIRIEDSKKRDAYHQKGLEELSRLIEESQAEQKAEQEVQENAEKAKYVKHVAYCKACGGTGLSAQNKITCGACNGNGGKYCNRCGGSGYVYNRSASGKVSSSYCTSCRGAGKITCLKCGGSGYLYKKDAPPCNVCKGTGLAQ